MVHRYRSQNVKTQLPVNIILKTNTLFNKRVGYVTGSLFDRFTRIKKLFSKNIL